jgi:methylated-DNA-[protein]-cysteine S-methyltransferase
MAAILAADKLVWLTFGHRSKRDAMESLPPSDAETGNEDDSQTQRVVKRLQAFAAGDCVALDGIKVDYGVVTDFQRKVLDACRAIPPGETLSYAELAVIAGAPGAARAVGNVMRTNRIPLVIPCHRVVGSGGSLGGYSAPDGLAMKRKLLEREATSRS